MRPVANTGEGTQLWRVSGSIGTRTHTHAHAPSRPAHLRLDVAMRDAQRVAVGHGAHDLREHGAEPRLAEVGLLRQPGQQLPAAAILLNHHLATARRSVGSVREM